MNLRMTISVLLAVWLAGCDKASDPVVGTSSETVTGVRLYLPSGAPAANARVQVYAVADTGNVPVAQVFTNAQGLLSFEAPAKGSYNLLIRHPDGTSLLEDSLVSDGSRMTAWSDTLRVAGGVKGRVRVQSKDSPRIAWVHLLGSGLYANVDDSGRFELSEVAPGRYTVAFLTRDTAYTPTFRSARVWPDSSLDMGTVDLVYTGLPLVTGLAASYDTAEGVLTLRWNRIADQRIAGYGVYSGDASVASYRTTDTLLTIRYFSGGGFDSSGFDTTNVLKSFRVGVIDRGGKAGIAWGNVSVQVVSPFFLSPVMASWQRMSNNPFSTASGNYAYKVDTLNGSLVAMRSAYGSAMVEVAVTTDGATWSSFVTTRTGDDFPFSSGGKLLRLEGHVADSSLIGKCAFNDAASCSLYDSAEFLSYEQGAWRSLVRFKLFAGVNSVRPIVQGDGVLVLQSSRYDGYPLSNLTAVTRCQGGQCQTSDSLRKLLADVSVATSTYTYAWPGKSGIWTIFQTEIRRIVPQTPEIHSQVGGAVTFRLVDNGAYVYLLSAKRAAVSVSGASLKWRYLERPPLSGVEWHGNLGSGEWSGKLVVLGDAGVFLGTISPR